VTGRSRSHAARTGHGPRRAAAAAVALSVLLAGSSGCGEQPVAAAPPADQPVELCSDAAGDGGAADLLSITRVTAAEQIFLAFSFVTELPAGPVTLTLRSPSPLRVVTIALRDGRPVAATMEAGDSAATAEHPEEIVHVAGADIHVVLPAVMMPAESRGWTVVTTAGSARDECGPSTV
jgi:hypothetical protein